MLSRTVKTSVKKKEPKPKLLVRISSGGVGIFHVKGWGPKSWVCPSKLRKAKLFGGISRDFAGYPGGPKNVEKKKFVLNFRPLKTAKTVMKATPLKLNHPFPTSLYQEGKNSLKIKFLDRIFLGHQGPRRRDIPDKNSMQVALFCCFRQGVAGMSRDLGGDVPDLEKLYARKLWADFSFPICSNSVLTLYGLVLAPILHLSSGLWFWELNCSFKPIFCP